MTQMIDISIIIVSWNARHFLSKCLQSLVHEAIGLRPEIIVVDNASTDGSPEMVRKEFPEIKVICTGANLGFAKANNIGIRESSGRYLCLVNSDVEVLRGCIGSMISYMEQHPEIGLLGPKVLNPDLTLQSSVRGFPTLWNSFCRALALDKVFPKSRLFGGYLLGYYSGNRICDVDALSGAFMLVKREAVDAVGLIDEDFFMYSEDIDWCMRFHKAGWKVVYFTEAKVIHYGGGSSSNDPIKFYIEQQRSRLRYCRKHHNKFCQKSLLFIILFHHILRVIGWLIIFLFKPSNKQAINYKIKRSLACIRWLINASASK